MGPSVSSELKAWCRIIQEEAAVSWDANMTQRDNSVRPHPHTLRNPSSPERCQGRAACCVFHQVLEGRHLSLKGTRKWTSRARCSSRQRLARRLGQQPPKGWANVEGGESWGLGSRVRAGGGKPRSCVRDERHPAASASQRKLLVTCSTGSCPAS